MQNKLGWKYLANAQHVESLKTSNISTIVMALSIQEMQQEGIERKILSYLEDGFNHKL